MNKDKRCKASKSEFDTVWPGLKRCVVCGFTLATFDSEETEIDLKGKVKPKYPKEDALHSTYHGKFYKCRSEYGSLNVLAYSDLMSKIKEMESYLLKIKENDVSKDIAGIPNMLTRYNSYLEEVSDWCEAIESNKNHEMLDFAKSLKSDISKVLKKSEVILNLYKDAKLENIISIVLEFKGLSNMYIETFMTLASLKAIKNDTSSPAISIYGFTFDLDGVVETLQVDMLEIPSKLNRVDALLQNFFSVEFTKSLRLWDMCRPHPRFEDYQILLWNTPKFQELIKPYLTDFQYFMYIRMNKANRQLFDFKFKDVPFYFGKVMETDVCFECHKVSSNCVPCDSNETLENCYKCANCVGCDVIDISYVDTLIGIPEEDAEDIDLSEDDEEIFKSFEVLSNIITSKR